MGDKGDSLQETPINLLHNFMRLQYLINDTASTYLRSWFCKLWQSTENKPWENTRDSGKIFIEGLGKKLHDKSQIIQRKYLTSGNVNCWDLPLLVAAIKCYNHTMTQEVKTKQIDLLDELKSLRNDMAHSGNVRLDDELFKKHWEKACIILKSLGISQAKIDEAESLKLQEEQKTETFEADSEAAAIHKQAEELKNKGNNWYAKGALDKAIDAYTEGVMLQGVSPNALAVFYANRSIAYLKNGDFSSAKDDAKGALTLRPTWWRGYSRLASVYIKLRAYEKGLKNCEIALGMQPTAVEVQNDRDLCRHMIAKMKREEHLDPINFVDTYADQALIFKRKGWTTNPLELQNNQQINYNMGLPSGICGEAHKYAHGMGVQQNYEMAARLFSNAASKGNAEGIYNLAMLTREGKGVKCDIIAAHRLLLEAANKDPITELLPGTGIKSPNIGVMEAQHALGLSYENGVGLPVDFKLALYWYKKALDNESGNSANNIALIYSEGKLGFPDIPLAILYWKIATLKGTVRAMENIAHFYCDFGDFKKAQDWYLYAVGEGSVSLLLSKEKFRIGPETGKTFDAETFRNNLKEEMLRSPLNHLAVAKEISMENLLKEVSDVHMGMSKLDPMFKNARVETIVHHRQGFNFSKKGKNHNYAAGTPKLFPKAVVDLIGLKPILFKDMKVSEDDHVYEGYLIKLTVIEDAIMGRPSIPLIVQDSNGDVNRVFVYNFPQNEETQDKLGYGCSIAIVNPYLRIMNDHRQAIRIDDSTSYLFTYPQLADKTRCRYCGQSKGTVICRKCRRVYYCSKKCMKSDLEDQKHDLVCVKKL